MKNFRRLILEIHRRSLWQVLPIYLGASWGVLEATDHIVQRFEMPQWVYGGVTLLLLVGLPAPMRALEGEPGLVPPERGADRPQEGVQHPAGHAGIVVQVGTEPFRH